MRTIDRIKNAIAKFAPEELAEKWDNTGILVDSKNSSSSKQILLCIDFTDTVLEECLSLEVKYVVAYHPVIFPSIKNLTDDLLIRAIKNDISIYSPHTQLDPLMNQYLQSLIGSEPLSLLEIVNKIKSECRLSTLRIVYANDCVNKDHMEQSEGLLNGHNKNEHINDKPPREEHNGQIKRVLNGRLSKIYTNNGDIKFGVGAAFRKVDFSDCLIITGEMSHHDLLKCKRSNVDVILMEHSNSERVFLKELRRLLMEDLPDFNVMISLTDKDPVEFI
jgi:putative NIF3 family GTP cyclohydrolase 1 type 2